MPSKTVEIDPLFAHAIVLELQRIEQWSGEDCGCDSDKVCDGTCLPQMVIRYCSQEDTDAE